MILQAAEPMVTEMIKTLGVPLAQLLIAVVLVKRYVMTPANGRAMGDLKTLTEGLGGEFRSMIQAQDLSRTQHFDQLRRDLTTTIEKQAQLSRDDLRNALGTLLLEQELGRLRAGDK